MIKVFENTEALLFNFLGQFTKTATNLRCIHLHVSQYHANQFNHIDERHVVSVTEEILDDKGSYVFRCHDSDIFIIAPYISPKLYKTFLSRLVEELRLDSDQNLASFLELGHDGDTLIDSVKQKIDALEQEEKKAIKEHLYDDENKPRIKNHRPVLSLLSTTYTHETPRILVIEDDEFSQALIANAFLAELNIEFAATGMQGIQKYVDSAPDIVLLDIGLPDMSGHEVMGTIRELDPNAKIIMLTARNEVDEIHHSLESGAQGYVSKPFSKAALLQHMKIRPVSRQHVAI